MKICFQALFALILALAIVLPGRVRAGSALFDIDSCAEFREGRLLVHDCAVAGKRFDVVLEWNAECGCFVLGDWREIEETPALPGLGEPCIEFFRPCLEGLVCRDGRCAEPGAGSGGDAGGGSGAGGKSGGCSFPVGHPGYCFSCGPCAEGEGGCNRNYQCEDGLFCDLATNTCRRPGR